MTIHQINGKIQYPPGVSLVLSFGQIHLHARPPLVDSEWEKKPQNKSPENEKNHWRQMFFLNSVWFIARLPQMNVFVGFCPD